MAFDDGFPPSPMPDDDASGRVTVVVASSVPLSVDTGAVDHPSIPDDAIGLGTFIDGRLLGRQAMDERAVPAYEELLSTPRRLAYVAYATEDGSVEGQLAALVKPSEIRELGRGMADGPRGEEDEDEPWKASVPSFEPEADRSSAGSDEPGDHDHVALLPLGLVVRMAQRRVHPDDLAAEAADVLRTVVNEGAVEIVDQFLDTI